MTKEAVLKLLEDAFVDLVQKKKVNLTSTQSASGQHDEHRQNADPPLSAALGLITRSLSKKDPEYHEPGAREAEEAEMTKLENVSTWDEAPLPNFVARRSSKATFVRMFCLLGIKHSENALLAKYKARCVAQGNDVRGSDGAEVTWSDTSSTPSSMDIMRSLITWSLSQDVPPMLADAVQAYVQASLPDSYECYINIPPHLWTKKMRTAAEAVMSKYECKESQLVWRLRRPLYGLSVSGALWQRHLGTKMKTKGWAEVPGVPSTWYKLFKDAKGVEHMSICSAYVDDLLLCGQCQDQAWADITSIVSVTEPEKLTRLLGVDHTFKKTDGFWTCDISMTSYLLDAVAKYDQKASDLGGPRRHNKAMPPWKCFSPS